MSGITKLKQIHCNIDDGIKDKDDVYSSFDLGKNNVYIDIPVFNIEITKAQYDYLMQCMNYISNYKQFQVNYSSVVKYKYFRPKIKYHGHYRQWWKYAIKMVVKNIRYYKGDHTAFAFPKQIIEKYENDFQRLFMQFYLDKAQLSPDELVKLQNIIDVIDIKYLFMWSKIIIQELYANHSMDNSKQTQSKIKKHGTTVSNIFGNQLKGSIELSEDDGDKIEAILEIAIDNEIRQIQTDDMKTDLKINLILRDGSFKFISSNDEKNRITEGFTFIYQSLQFCIQKGANFHYFQLELNSINIGMTAEVNDNKSVTPITFHINDIGNIYRDNQSQNHPSKVTSQARESNFIFLSFSKNPPMSTVNSSLTMQVNELDFIYNQVFGERFGFFFSVEVDESGSNLAWDTYSNFKETTHQTIGNNLNKKNDINVTICPRIVLGPINKYDIKNSKMLLLNFGNIALRSDLNSLGKDTQNERLKLSANSFKTLYFTNISDIAVNNGFDIIEDLSIAGYVHLHNNTKNKNGFTQYKASIDIDNITINITEYLLSLGWYLNTIIKPTRNNDIWSQLNMKSSKEIISNSNNIVHCFKKNNSYFIWEEYYVVLLNGYGYFYGTLDNDAEYEAYFYLKNTSVSMEMSKMGIIELTNSFGIIELMFEKITEMNKWVKDIQGVIEEMRICDIVEVEGKNKELEAGKGNIVESKDGEILTLDIQLKSVSVNGFVQSKARDDVLIRNNYEKMFEFILKMSTISCLVRQYDYSFDIGMSDILIRNLMNDNNRNIVISNDKHGTPYEGRNINGRDEDKDEENKGGHISILICDEHSNKYSNTQIAMDIKIGDIIVYWHPEVIRALGGIILHNDITKYSIEQEISNELSNDTTNFFKKAMNTNVIKQKCVDFTAISLSVHSTFKSVELIWIQPIINTNFALISLTSCALNLEIAVDHHRMFGTLCNMKVFDLINYPYGTSQNSQDSSQNNQIFSMCSPGDSEGEIMFDYYSMFTWCPHSKSNFTSKAAITMNQWEGYYIHEYFIRCFTYFTSEFLNALSPNERVIRFRNEKYNINAKKEADIDFLDLNVTMLQPRIILKPRLKMTECFKCNGNTIAIKCSHQKVIGKGYRHPEEYRWNTTYMFTGDQLSVSSDDGFKICENVNGLLNMHIVEYTQTDRINYTAYDFNYSYQFDCLFTRVECNLRQRDFTSLIRGGDGNIGYSDNREKEYNYENMRIFKGQESRRNTQSIGISACNDTEDPAMGKEEGYFDGITYLFIDNIKVNLFLSNDSEFINVNCVNIWVDFTRKLDTSLEFDIKITDMKAYNSGRDILISSVSGNPDAFDTNVHELGLSRLTQPAILSRELFKQAKGSKKPQCNIQVNINANYEKAIVINGNGFLCFLQMDILILLYSFFMEGFPYYEPNSEDLPSGFDPTDENPPPISMFLEIKKPGICLLTSPLKNTKQDGLCLTSEVVIGLQTDKMSKIKKCLSEKYINLSQTGKKLTRDDLDNDIGYSYNLSISFGEISPFISNMTEILDYSQTNNSNFFNIYYTRKIIDNFTFCYENKEQIQYQPPNNYIRTSIEKLNINKITVISSFTELLGLYKMTTFNLGIMNNAFGQNNTALLQFTKSKNNFQNKVANNANMNTSSIVQTTSPSNSNMSFHNKMEISNTSISGINKDIIIDKGISNGVIMSQGGHIIGIDDHSNTYYPCMSIIVNDFSLMKDGISKLQSLISANMSFKIHYYNYYAGAWEPVLEKTKMGIEINDDISDTTCKTHMINIKSVPTVNRPVINLNISDLCLCYLMKTLKKWYEIITIANRTNYKSLNIDESRNTMKLSNHTIINYTGKSLVVYRKSTTKDGKVILMQGIKLKPNNSYEIEFFKNEDFGNGGDDTLDIMENLTKENYIVFDFVDKKYSIQDNTIKIDNMQTKYHFCPNKGNPIANASSKTTQCGDFLISKIHLKHGKKHIYLYSPGSFKNKTEFCISFTLMFKSGPKGELTLQKKQTLGIPFEYGNGTISISINNESHKIFNISSFLSDNLVLEEIKFNNVYLNGFHPKGIDHKNKIIRIRGSYAIYNALPFQIQLILNEEKQMYTINKGETVLIPCLSLKKSLKCYIYFYSFHTNNEVYLYNVKTQNKQSITSLPILGTDNDKHSGTIYSSLITGDSKKLIIHASSVLINHTGGDSQLHFYYWKNEKETVEISNQTSNYNFFIGNDEKYIIVKYNKGEYISNKISISAIGTSSIVEGYNKNDCAIKLEFIMEISLSIVNIRFDIYTNIISFVPRFLLFNLSDIPVMYSIGNSFIDTLEINEKKPGYNHNHHLLRFKPGDDDHWEMSSPIVGISGAFCTGKIKHKRNKTKVMYLNIERKIDSLSTYIIIKPSNFDNCHIIIENYSKTIRIKASQFRYEENEILLSPKTKSIFAWDNSIESTVIKFDFLLADFRYHQENSSKYFDLQDSKIYEIEVNPTENTGNTVDESDYPYDKLGLIYKNGLSHEGYKLKIKIKNEGGKIYIVFNDYIENTSVVKKKKTYFDEYEVNVYLDRGGVSVIGDNKNGNKNENKLGQDKIRYSRNEICYVLFEEILLYNKVMFTKLKRTNEVVNTKNDIQIVIRDGQIDNEISYLKSFGIVLMPGERRRQLKIRKKRESVDNGVKGKNNNNNNSNANVNTSTSNNTTLNNIGIGNSYTPNNTNTNTNTNTGENNDNNIQPFFNCAIFTTTSSADKITTVVLFNYLIQAFAGNIESNVLVGLINFFQNITLELRTSLTPLNPIFLNDVQIEGKRHNYNVIIKECYFMPLWIKKKRINQNQNIFVNELIASSLEIQLTFINQTKDKVFQQLLQSNKILASGLSTISNIEKVNLCGNGLTLNNFSGTFLDISSNILYGYQQKMLVQIGKGFGSIDILGDPLNLLTSLGKGFQDLFQKPAKGIMKGPLQGAIGLVGGTGSLAKHTFDGTLNSTSKLTSGISKGVGLLTLDNAYINEREKKKITQRPKNIFEGIGYGLTSMAGGIYYGVTDIVKKPIEGAKKEKLKGFGKGLLKGLGGAVLKPISGVFDLVSKTTEGIKNTVNIDENYHQKRGPRTFYGKYKIIKSYNKLHSEVLELLILKIDALKHMNFDFYSCEIFKNNVNEHLGLAFLSTGIYVVDIGKKELKLIILYKNINDVVISDNNTVVIGFNKSIEGNSFYCISLGLDSYGPGKIVEKIKNAIEQSYQENSEFV